jgi:lysophospholipase L1-like esterase
MVKNGLLVLGLALIWLAASSLPVSSQTATDVPHTSGIQEIRSLAVVWDQTGELWAAWEADTGTDAEIYFSRWNGEDWTPPKPVHSRPEAWDRSPSLAVAANGEIWLVWSSTEKSDLQRRQLYTSRWTGERWTNAEIVPIGDISRAKAPALAAPPRQAGIGAQDGTLWLIWVGFDGTDDEIFASHWDGEAWLPPQQISADDDHRYFYDLEPQVAVGSDGRPWVVWTGYEAGLDDEIFASRWMGDGWTPEQRVSRDDEALDATPTLALDAQDRPWVAWAARADGEQMPTRRILASRWDPVQSSWTEEALASSAPAAEVIEDYPTLALDSHGRMHLGWTVRGLSGSVLAKTQWEGNQWAQPELAGTDATDDTAILTFTTDGRATFLQLAPSPDGQAPVKGETVKDEAIPLDVWSEQPSPSRQIQADAIWNRYLSFGDSITQGGYDGNTPYPTRLEFHLDTRVLDSDVINGGLPGERTGEGLFRIEGLTGLYQPAHLFYMEGTNDVTKGLSPNKVYDNIWLSLKYAKRAVRSIRPMVATLIPRQDDLNPETVAMNEQAVIPAAQDRNAAVCDQWTAFQSYGDLPSLYRDHVHPNQTGLNLLADTFYDCMLASWAWIVEETTPPVTWIDPLPPTSYSRSIAVSWDGTDNLSWVVDYDVQVKVNSGAWTDWLLSTQDTSGTYSTANYGDTVSFRVRGRDLVGNENDYGTPESTQILTTIYVHQLPAYQAAPFPVSWSVRDPLFHADGYEVDYNVNGGAWQDWLSDTTATSGDFDPPSPQYNQDYCFRARARYDINKWLPWSDPECTLLARYAVRGQVHNVRHEPIIGAELSLTPAPTYLDRETFGRFSAYLLAGGDYDIDVWRNDLFGPLPPMSITVADTVEGLDFVLPPQDDVVSNGGFEEATLSGWQAGGTLPPTLTPEAHTGSHAVTLGGLGESSWLTQTLTVPPSLGDTTLSFMVRLDDGSAGSSTLDIELIGTPISLTQQVPADSWTHVWLPVDAALGEVVTLNLTVSDNPAILLDEVSLGTAVVGGSMSYLPFVAR